MPLLATKATRPTRVPSLARRACRALTQRLSVHPRATSALAATCAQPRRRSSPRDVDREPTRHVGRRYARCARWGIGAGAGRPLQGRASMARMPRKGATRARCAKRGLRPTRQAIHATSAPPARGAQRRAPSARSIAQPASRPRRGARAVSGARRGRMPRRRAARCAFRVRHARGALSRAW